MSSVFITETKLWDFVTVEIREALSSLAVPKRVEETLVSPHLFMNVLKNVYSVTSYEEEFPLIAKRAKKTVLCKYLKPVKNLAFAQEGNRCENCFWLMCKCEYRLDEMSFLQKSELEKKPSNLKGGARPPKVIIPKLRIIQSENEIIDLFANIVRSFSPYWHLYDSHDPCKFDNHKSCVFCSVRSLSLRLNERKQEATIVPHEMLTDF